MKIFPTIFMLLAGMGAIALAASANAQEQGLDQASLEALMKTQQLLRNPGLRNQAIVESADAQAADAQVQKLVGTGAARDQIYSVSSEVFSDMVKASQGDPEAMKAKLEAGTLNPHAFYQGMSPANQQAVQDLARQIQGQVTAAGRAPASQP